MALYYVVRDNKLVKRGTYLEEVDPGLVQPVYMDTEDRRYVPCSNYGVVFPLSEVRDDCVKFLKHGIDKRW